jgi:hypothetical protein
VPTKVTVVEHGLIDQIVPRISLFANTQNVVQMADFSANEPFHIEFERLANTIWCPGERGRWFYERARGQYQVARSRAATPAQLRRFNEQTPAHRKLTKTDLSRYLQSWSQEPQAVSAGAQKNFVKFMRDLRQQRGKDWLPDESFFKEAVAKAILFKAVERLIRRMHLPSYRAQVAAYVVSALSRRVAGRMDLGRIWNLQAISDELEALLSSWVQPVSDCIHQTAGRLNVGEWCKKDGCWEAVAQLDLELPATLPPELLGTAHPGAARSQQTMTPAAYDEIAECKKLGGEAWFAIHAWGQKSGLLADWQVGIAHTLSGYAAGGWRKDPSPKQARHGARIIAIAREHGVQLAEVPKTTTAAE